MPISYNRVAPRRFQWTLRQSSAGLSGILRASASSADGSVLAVAGNPGYIYISTNFGATWTARATEVGAVTWNDVAMSADGTKLVATIWNGATWTSTNSGFTWTSQGGGDTPATMRYAVASSADGTKLVASIYATTTQSNIMNTSTDSGVTWTQRTCTGLSYGFGVSSSADGVNLIVVDGSPTGVVYNSFDSGLTWTKRGAVTAGSRTALASSSDGSKAATYMNSQMLTSTTYGSTWTSRGNLDLGYGAGITMSADGTMITAVTSGSFPLGNIWTSLDSGVSWSSISPTVGGQYQHVSCSSNGARLLVVVPNGAYIGVYS